MKYITVVFALFALVILVGCSNSQVPVDDESTVVVQTKTSTVAPEPTATIEPMATQTLTPFPTATSELVESGYDIADVRLSYPREDTLVVNFKYRLEESRKSRDTYISMTIPPQCRDDGNRYSPPQYVAKNLTGEVEFTFKMTLEGVCTTDSIEFTFYSDPNRGTTFYREYVLQPYRLVRDFPTVNSDTLQVENLNFTATTGWGGLFTFDFHLSEQIPLPLEQYRFSIYGFGPDGSCPFEVYGSHLTQHNGEYMILLRLPQNFMTLYQTCLGGADKYTYTASYLALNDDLAQRSVYHQALNEQFTIFKAP